MGELIQFPGAWHGAAPLPHGSQIRDMDIGEEGYVVPWAMFIDKDGYCYLNINFQIFEDPEGAAQMRVLKVDDNAVACDVSACKNFKQQDLTPVSLAENSSWASISYYVVDIAE